MNQAPTLSPRSDPGGHGGFTYMVMYSVRAQSSRYIGLSQSSDTVPHRAPRNVHVPSPAIAVVPLGPHLFLLPRYSYTLFDIAVSRVPQGRYSHCMPCRRARQHTVGLAGGRHGVDDGAENPSEMARTKRERERDAVAEGTRVQFNVQRLNIT